MPEHDKPKGYQAGLEFSTTWEYRPGYAVGIEFADEAPEPSDGRTLKPFGFSHTAYGTPEIRNTQLLVKPTGYNGLSFGTPFTRNTADFIRPQGSDYLQFSQPVKVELLHRPIYPQGWRSEGYGAPTIYNLVQHIAGAGNIGSRLAFGMAQIENLDRYIPVGGIDAAAFGTTSVTHETRYIHPVMPNRLAFGTLWASHSPRSIEAGGLYATQVGYPVAAGTRRIEALGWDSQAFGTRIIPEIHAVYPLGMTGQWGWPTIYNHDWHVAPKGFITTISEAERFGTAYFYNSRQYLRAYHSESSQAAGEAFGIWTEIKNRNRYVTTHGHDSMVVQRQYIENAARALEPKGLDSQTFGGAFAAAGVRELTPEGIEPPYFSGWLSVLNTAKVIQAQGFDAAAIPGGARLANNRRSFQRIGNWDSMSMGGAFVDYGVRTITIDHRQSIPAPTIYLPTVDNLTKYIEPAGLDALRVMPPSLHIHWNKLYPRSGDLSQYGMPEVSNVTPELKFHGTDMQEHGRPAVHLYTRYVTSDGAHTQQFGGALIRDKRSWIYPLSQDFASFSNKNEAYNEKPDPPGEQRIQPVSMPAHESELRQKFGQPHFNQQVIYHTQTEQSLKFGNPAIHQNVIRMEVGIYDYFAIGRPEVSLLHRAIDVAEQGIESNFAAGKPRFSPFTIWATTDAPEQADNNHIPPSKRYHPVDNPPEPATKPKGFGRPTVSLQHRYITRATVPNLLRPFGTHSVSLGTNYIEPKGWRLSVVGWHSVPHFIREVECHTDEDMTEFGQQQVKHAPYTGPQEIKPEGIAGAVGSHRIENYHRELELPGFDSLRMGASGQSPRHMQQRLWVGMPDWPQMQGFDASQFGEAWISDKVREIKTEGHDSFTMEYDLNNFNARMRVSIPWWSQPQPEEAARLEPQGIDSLGTGVPAVRNAVHIIRPDGNADAFRKGAGND